MDGCQADGATASEYDFFIPQVEHFFREAQSHCEHPLHTQYDYLDGSWLGNMCALLMLE